VIFGVMAKLCGMWRSTMRGLIWADKRGSSDYAGSVDWALAGYDGWPAVPDPAGDGNNCRADSCPCIGPNFTLHWYPSAAPETVGTECEAALQIHGHLRDDPPSATPGF
jgi:hypothetical protein